MTYIIMGPQGSGKGTQAKLIAKEFGIEHVSIGDVLRAEVAKKTEIGKIVEKYMHEGKLIPLELNNQIVRGVIEGRDDIIIDGYPRNLDQAKYLFEHFKIQGLIVLEIGEEESIKRISKRRICTANNKVLIADEITQKDIDDCKALGGDIIIRDDDRPDAIKKRLQIYHENTEPLITLFKKHKVPVVRINGERSVDELFNEIKYDVKHIFEKK